MSEESEDQSHQSAGSARSAMLEHREQLLNTCTALRFRMESARYKLAPDMLQEMITIKERLVETGDTVLIGRLSSRLSVYMRLNATRSILTAAGAGTLPAPRAPHTHPTPSTEPTPRANQPAPAAASSAASPRWDAAHRPSSPQSAMARPPEASRWGWQGVEEKGKMSGGQRMEGGREMREGASKRDSARA